MALGPRIRPPIPIRSVQDAYDEGIYGNTPPPAGVYPWGMSPELRALIAGYPYVGAAAAPPVAAVSPTSAVASAGPLGYDPRALLAANPAPTTPPAAPTSVEDLLAQRWQEELLAQQAQRLEQRRQFDIRQKAMEDEAILQRFGQYTPATQPQATGQAGEAMAARSAISKERTDAQNLRTQLQAAVGAQSAPQPQPQAPPETVDTALGWRPIVGGPTVRGGIGMPDRPLNIRPEWISGPAFGMSADQSAANTMRGNQAFGIHVDRGNTVGRGASTLQNLASSSIGSTQGEADYANLERQVLGDPNNPDQYPASPRASILLREEDPGVNATPAERAYLALRRRRRQLGGQVRGGTPYDTPAY